MLSFIYRSSFENKLNMFINHIFFILNLHAKYKFALKLFTLWSFPIYFYYKICKNDKVANFVYYGKTWLQ